MSRLLCAICHKYRASRGYFPPRCTDCRRMEIVDAYRRNIGGDAR